MGFLDIRIEKTERAIKQAFMELRAQKPVEKIKVKELCDLACINKSTFYAHYQDIRAVIEQIENDIIEKMIGVLSEFQYKNFFQNPLPLLLKIARYLEEDLEFYRILINSNGANAFLIKLKNIFVSYMENNSDAPEEVKKTSEFHVRTNFFAGGVINLYQLWFRGDLDLTLNDLSLEISKIISASPLHFKE